MTHIDRGVVHWGGSFPGGPGVSVFYAIPASSMLSHLHTFFASCLNALPSDVTLTFPNAGDTIEDTTGELVGSWSASAETPLVGTDVSSYSAPSGVCFAWGTSTLAAAHAGKPPRKVRGRTFLVPCGGGTFDVDGSPKASFMTVFNDAATALLAASPGNLGVWHRPTSKGGSDGVFAPITSFVVKDKAAVLTSRRD